MSDEVKFEHEARYSSPKENQLPSLLARVKAVIIDFIILLLVFSVTSVITGMFVNVPAFVRGAFAVLMLLLYDPLLTTYTGGTLGHKLIGLRVKKYEALDQNISFLNALFRFLVKATLGWLSFLTVTSSKAKRAIHDTLSGSIVLK
jgi:uncharacterized RDD family membrane protein YckC